jgi:rhomboid protease GluP
VNNSSDVATQAAQPRQLPLPLARPRLTYVLLGINILVWLAMTATGGSTSTAVLIRFGAKDNSLIANGEVWRLLTSMFLHIGLMHLFFNSYALYIFGIEVERLYGNARFVVIYLLAGLWGSLISFAFGPNLSAGASGAIFGLLGVMLAFFRRHRELFGDSGRRQVINLLGIAVFNLVLGFTVPGIDNLAHLGGLVSGAILGWLLAPEYQVGWDAEGHPQVRDRNSLLSRWWVVALATVLLAAGIRGGMALQQGSASVLMSHGQRALQSGDLAAAESFFQQAVARDPASADARFYLGVTLFQQERTHEAAQAYENALRLEPDLAEAHWNLALAYADLRRPGDAINQLQAFISLRPDGAEADQARAMIAELQSASP